MTAQNSDSPSPPVASRIAAVRERIRIALIDSGRVADSVQLVAVSKQQTAAAVRALAGVGQCDFGENYLQEALDKQRALSDLQLIWHFIGQLQSNKTRPIAVHFQWVHTVDRLKIALRLSEQRPNSLPPLNACIQVKLAEESGKGGVWPSEVPALAEQIATLPRIKLRGLMCIPPPSSSFAAQRAYFDKAADLLKQLNQRGFALDTLSMGMTDDLEAAIASGANTVRIGTAIFGEREK